MISATIWYSGHYMKKETVLCCFVPRLSAPCALSLPSALAQQPPVWGFADLHAYPASHLGFERNERRKRALLGETGAFTTIGSLP
jgi:hypothetical protein